MVMVFPMWMKVNQTRTKMTPQKSIMKKNTTNFWLNLNMLRGNGQQSKMDGHS